MAVLVTGAAGFIGMHVAQALARRGDQVIGIDNLNAYYDVTLKEARVAELAKTDGVTFERLDVTDARALGALFHTHQGINRVIHLAAQAGVRYSLTDPQAYVAANVVGHLTILEACRHHVTGIKHLVYASSSSVYGGNTEMPFSVADRVDHPISIYAASKRSAELMSDTYAHLYGLPQTGLRFFTVYGPWGRPDMSAFLFTRAILAGEPIRVFNHGDMRRDFTFIDDIVAGVLGALDRPPEAGGEDSGKSLPHRIYNLGNHRSEQLLDFIETIEQALGRKAEKIMEPMQPGDVPETYADIEASQRDLGFEPKTTIREGIPKFVDWYRRYHKV